jgi:hypothetical protein
MAAASSAILKPTLKDRTAFVASPRRAVRTRPATVEERAEAGLSAETEAVAVLLRLCRGTLKVVVAKRPLAGNVTEAASTFATLCGRPQEEALAAATYLGMIPADDIAELGHRMMADRASCSHGGHCHCAGGYAPLVITLAEAAARAAASPWLLSGLTEHIDKIQAAVPGPINVTSPFIKSAADAVSDIVEAAGYPAPLNRA